MKKVLLFLIGAFLLVGCAPITIQKLPAYDLALKMGGYERPKIFYDNSIKVDFAITPYAVLSTVGDKDFSIRRIWKKAAELKADLVFIKDGSMQSGGSIGTVTPTAFGGMVFSLPVYQQEFYGYLYRLNPASLGMETDQVQMIVAIENDSIREAGIIEGDKIISVNGFAYAPGAPELLKIQEGEEVKITIIRPGTGKIEKNIKTIKNKSTFTDYPDAIPWETPNLRPAEQE